jgi:1,4-dihydroxy-2-naphthoate octaprenyltransferase
MSSISTTSERSVFSLWVQASRPFAYPASVIPMVVATVWTLTNFPGKIHWELLPLILIAGILFHTGTNLVSEYFDYKKGVDKADTFGSSRILVDGLMNPKTVLYGGYAAFAIGFLLGLVLVAYWGYPILILGSVGLLGGLFYTGFPVGYKYFALGDIFVFMLFGPLMMLGTFMGLTGEFSWNVVLLSIPLGLLVAAILHANNIRDIMSDSKAKIKTFAILFGLQGAKYEYYALVMGAYFSVILMVALQIISPWTLLVLLSIKPAIDNIKFVSGAKVEQPELILMSDVKTAQHQLLFGVLYAIGLLIGYWV